MPLHGTDSPDAARWSHAAAAHPFRAALGLVATALDEARTLPDKAIELPMLAVSTALQMSLRAQQRYAALAARGDELLAGRAASPTSRPPWATFDEPVDASPAAAGEHVGARRRAGARPQDRRARAAHRQAVGVRRGRRRVGVARLETSAESPGPGPGRRA